MLMKTALLTALAAAAITVPAAASAQDYGRGYVERPHMYFHPEARPIYFHRAWWGPAHRPFVRYAPYGYRVAPYGYRVAPYDYRAAPYAYRFEHPRPYGY